MPRLTLFLPRLTLAAMVLTLLHAASAGHLYPPRSAMAMALKAQSQPAQFFVQKLDHFAANDSRSFEQKYYVDDSHYRPPHGPVFLYISGEAPLYGAPSGAGSIIGELAALHGAAVFAVEHRYYGDSLPFTLLDLPNLAYLNSGQALLDLVAFRGFAAAQLAQRHGYDDAAGGGGPWVAFGGSYAGALATWLRLKYPHLIAGALASSAVVRAVESYTDFDLHLGRTVGHECASALRAANLAVDARLAKSPKASATVKASFDAAALSDGDLRLLLADAHAMAVQYGYKEMVCGPMVAARRAGHDLVSALANFTTSFFYPTLEQGGSREYDAAYLAVEQIDPAMTGRQWRYQQFSEVGWFQNAPAKDAVRSPKLDASYQRAACARIFGPGVWPNVSAVNAHYGGAAPKVTNVFFSHGGEDPWQHAGVTADPSPTARARVAACDGCSHCVDLREVRADDPPELSRMREEISAHVASWLHSGRGRRRAAAAAARAAAAGAAAAPRSAATGRRRRRSECRRPTTRRPPPHPPPRRRRGCCGRRRRRGTCTRGGRGVEPVARFAAVV